MKFENFETALISENSIRFGSYIVFLPCQTKYSSAIVRGVSQEMGGGRLVKKAIGRWEVPEFWTRMWEVWILPVS